MSPQPVKDIDLDRKEELIMAKQLRAARVTILPKRVDSSYVAKKEPKPKPPPTPKAQPRSVAKAQNPIALRYWSQCMALSTQTEMNAPIVPEESLSKQKFDSSMPPWALSDTHLSPNLPNPSVNGGVHRKQADNGIKVPNINKQIKSDGNTTKRTDWAKILAEEDEHLEKHKTFKMNQNQRLNIQETPNFLRKHRSINSKNPSNVKVNHRISDTKQNKSLTDVENENFFEHIKKMKSIETKQDNAQSTKESLVISEKPISLCKTGSERNGEVNFGEPYHKSEGISTVKEKNIQNSLGNIKDSKKEKILQKNGNAVINEVGNGNEILEVKQEYVENYSDDRQGSGKQQTLNEKETKDTQDCSNEESQGDNASLSCTKRSNLKLQTWDWKSKPSPNIVKKKECSCHMSAKTFHSEDDLTDMGKFVNNITLSLDETQIKEVGILCFDKLSPNVKDDLVTRHLSAIHFSELTKLLSLIKEEVFVESLSNIIPKLSSSLQSSVSRSLSATKDTAIHCQPEQNDISNIKSNNGQTLHSNKEIKKNNCEQEVTSDKKMNNENENEMKTSKHQIGNGNPGGSFKEDYKNEVNNQTKEEDNIEDIIQNIPSLSSVKEDTEKSKSEKEKKESPLRKDHIGSMDKASASEENKASVFECSSSDEDMNISVDKIIEDPSIEVEDNENFKHNERKCLNNDNQSVRTESKDISQNLENQKEEDETSNDISHLEIEEKEADSFYKNDKDVLENGNSEVQMTDIEGSDPDSVASGDESWEYEWEEEDDYYEQDEDDEEYKVQTFDGSFSVSLKH